MYHHGSVTASAGAGEGGGGKQLPLFAVKVPANDGDVTDDEHTKQVRFDAAGISAADCAVIAYNRGHDDVIL
jgi:hypothetical protein